MTYDQAQSARLGQRLPPEQTGVRLLTSTDLPEVAFHGQIIYLLDLDTFAVYDATQGAWQLPTTGTGGTGAAGVQVFVVSIQPSADAVGDLWLNPTTNELKVWNGTAWVAVKDPAIYAKVEADAADALNKINALAGIVDAKVTVYYQPTAPSGADVNDLWFNTITNKAAIWTSGGIWQPITDNDINVALNAAGVAQALADGKIQHFVQVGAPWANGDTTHNSDYGDIWTSTTEGNKNYYWTGNVAAPNYNWVALPVGGGAVAPNAIGASQLAADAITAKHTLTGPILQTSVSGNRMVIKNDGSGGVILSYTGDVAERNQGQINPSVLGTGTTRQPILDIWSADFATTTLLDRAHIRLLGRSANGSIEPTVAIDNTLTVGKALDVNLAMTAAQVYVINPDPAPTGTSANVRILGGGQLTQVFASSAAKYKENIHPAEIDPAAVLAMDPVTFNYRPEVTSDNAVVIGFIADQAHELGLHHFVEYQDGEVESIRYDRWSVAQQVVLRSQQAEIEDLKTQLAELKDAVAALTATAE